MAYSDYPGLKGLAGTGPGGIPEDIYLRKIAVSDTKGVKVRFPPNVPININNDPRNGQPVETIEEYDEDNPELVDHFFRSTLKGIGTDRPVFESEEPRTDNYSRDRINLRTTGTRTDLDPWLPDGTFLDYEFTEKDPRGTAVGPDMRKYVEQQWARAPFIKFSSDESHSVPELAMNPYQMIEAKDKTFVRYRESYKNFEESFDNFHNGGTGKKRTSTAAALVTGDGSVALIHDSTSRQRRDPTHVLSNDPSVAFRHSTTDHRFKVQRYGYTTVAKGLESENWAKNRLASNLDDAKVKEINGVMVNKAFAGLIVDLEGLRKNKQASAQGATYGDSVKSQQRQYKLVADDVHKLMSMGVKASQGRTANDMLGDAKLAQRTMGTLVDGDFTSNRRATKLNNDVKESMKQATKKGADLAKIEEARENIQQSAVNNALYNETTTRAAAGLSENPAASREMIHASQSFLDGKQVANYSTVVPPPEHNSAGRDLVRYEDYKGESMTNFAGSRKGKYKYLDKRFYENTQDEGASEFGVYDRAQRASAESHKGRKAGQFDFGDTEVDEEVGDQDLSRKAREAAMKKK
jgi:hypothetical protein